MAIRDLYRNTYVTPSLAPAARVTGTSTGTAVDLLGFDAAVIAVAFGAWTDGTHTPSVLQSMDGTNFVPTALTDTDGTFTPVSGTSGANAVQSIGYIGTQRFVQVVMTVMGATTGALSSASVIAGYPRSGPTH
jgi:hypothetical protein